MSRVRSIDVGRRSPLTAEERSGFSDETLAMTLLRTIIDLSARYGVTPVEVRFVQKNGDWCVSTYVIESGYRMRLAPEHRGYNLVKVLRVLVGSTRRALDARYGKAPGEAK